MGSFLKSRAALIAGLGMAAVMYGFARLPALSSLTGTGWRRAFISPG